jgi:DNA polymerase-1
MAKQAMIDYTRVADGSRLLMSLHDELIITSQEGVAEREAEKLSYAMVNAFKLDVPLIAEAKIGRNFSEVK